MLYPRCPTCRTVLANKQVLYETRLAAICEDTKLTNEQKDKHKQDLLDDLELKRMCCRMRMMCYVVLVNIIK